MARPSNGPPVIIRRKKIIRPQEHHGGAWKVAYADFVTAMMAFFLLMWLLNATTEKQRKGLSDYFNPTIPVNRISGGGDGMLDGSSLFAQEEKVHTGRGGTANQEGGNGATTADTADQQGQIELQKAVEEALFDRGGESRTMEQLLRHVITKVTDEGLVIELFDLEDARLFDEDTAQPRPVTEALAAIISDVLKITNNRIAVNGYLRSYPIPLRDHPGWTLSSARARVMRDLLEQAGLPSRRFARIGGFSDRKPAVRNPVAIRNNRIEITLLRHDR